MKTQEEIEQLKRQWSNDPCWDIEDTEGFEDHYDELKAFSDEHIAEQNRKYNERIQREADAASMDFNTYSNYKAAVGRAEQEKSEAGRLLSHYFGLIMPMDSVNRSEVEGIIYHITESVKASIKADLIKEANAH